MKRLTTPLLLCAAALAEACAASAASAPQVKPPPPGQRGWLIVNRREIAACGRAGGKVSIIAHMRYCSVAFAQDRGDIHASRHPGG